MSSRQLHPSYDTCPQNTTERGYNPRTSPQNPSAHLPLKLLSKNETEGEGASKGQSANRAPKWTGQTRRMFPPPEAIARHARLCRGHHRGRPAVAGPGRKAARADRQRIVLQSIQDFPERDGKPPGL